ncbi:hypothetical protein J2X46_002967 [Nocardioides sp. BE266]|nr:hypothetical protein [Nocardioides sp. BE266]
MLTGLAMKGMFTSLVGLPVARWPAAGGRIA